MSGIGWMDTSLQLSTLNNGVSLVISDIHFQQAQGYMNMIENKNAKKQENNYL